MDKIYETANEQHVAAPILYANIITAGSGTTIDDYLYTVAPTDSNEGVVATKSEVERWFCNNGIIKTYVNGVYNGSMVKPTNMEITSNGQVEEYAQVTVVASDVQTNFYSAEYED